MMPARYTLPSFSVTLFDVATILCARNCVHTASLPAVVKEAISVVCGLFLFSCGCYKLECCQRIVWRVVSLEPEGVLDGEEAELGSF